MMCCDITTKILKLKGEKIIMNKTINMSKKDVINAKNARSIKDVTETPLTVTGCVFSEKEIEEKTTDTLALITKECGAVCTISATVIDAFYDVASDFSEEDFKKGIECIFHTRSSNNGREYIILELL